MKIRRVLEPNLDRFEGEGGALAGRAETEEQGAFREGAVPTTRAVVMGSWHVRPAFLTELDAILEARDASEAESRKQRNIASDLDEEFAQRFQELLDTQLIPHFESAADLLSKRLYPVELRVVGEFGERACFLAVSQTKQPGDWALYGGSITGPRMMFSANLTTRNVIYTANFRDGLPHTVHAVMKASEITDFFIEQELRQLFLSLAAEERCVFKPSLAHGAFIRAVRNVCA